MKELMESLKSGLTVSELAEKFREQTSNMIPGDWKVVGIRFYLLEESEDILAAPGFYSKDFKKEDYDLEEE